MGLLNPLPSRTISEEDIQALEDSLTEIISERVMQAVEHIYRFNPLITDRLESAIMQGLKLNDSKAAANHILDTCLHELAAVMYLSSLVVAGMTPTEEDEIRASSLRTDKRGPFGKRIQL